MPTPQNNPSLINKRKPLRLVIDANEANVAHRVGSNIYAFEMIKALEKLTREDSNYQITVLLSQKKVKDLPDSRENWSYKILGPKFLWTQFAEPLHLFLNKNAYDILFTPSHYAPRACAIAYISSVMDLAFLKFPEQFSQTALTQLKHWTKYSARQARKVIAISNFTKNDLLQTYHLKTDDVVVAPPAVTPLPATPAPTVKEFFKSHRLRKPYFLFIGTFQPRKNLLNLIEAYEKLARRLSSQNFGKNKRPKLLPQLVLAGKIGWLAEPIIKRIEASPFSKNIILPGFISDEIKPALYQNALANILIGFYEGFGIPPLEALAYGCLPIVSNVSSLPEVVGSAGLQVDPHDVTQITQTMETAFQLTPKAKAAYRKKGRQQLLKFSWEKSAQIVLQTIERVVS